MKKITVIVLIFALALFTACAPAAEKPLDNNGGYNNNGYIDDNNGLIDDDGYTDNRTYDQVTPNQNIPNTPNNGTTNYPNNMDMNPNNDNNNLRTTP